MKKVFFILLLAIGTVSSEFGAAATMHTERVARNVTSADSPGELTQAELDRLCAQQNGASEAVVATAGGGANNGNPTITVQP